MNNAGHETNLGLTGFLQVEINLKKCYTSFRLWFFEFMCLLD